MTGPSAQIVCPLAAIISAALIVSYSCTQQFIQAAAELREHAHMKNRQIFLVAILFALVVANFHAVANQPRTEDAELSGVVRQALSNYKKNGLSGLVAQSQNCYRMERPSLRCVQLDIAASQIDLQFAESIGIQRHPYYEPGPFFQRATPVFVSSGMNMQQANAFLARATDKISRLISLQTVSRP